MVLIAEGWSRLTKIIREERNRNNQFAAARRERDLEQARRRGLPIDWERGLEQGREQGLEQGREQGLERGLEQGREQGLEQGREQGLEQGLEQGREQGKEEMRAIIQERLELLGINPAEVLPPAEPEPAPDDDAALTAYVTSAELDDRIRRILQEQLERRGIRIDDTDAAPPQRSQ